jgi:hypothetical protein
MHFRAPEDGVWRFDVLPAQEEKRTLDGQQVRICEAGCYQCLLSYFNQPDHDLINRLDADALRVLTALAGANVAEVDPTVAAPPPDGALGRWLAALARLELRRPDATSVPLNGGAGTVDAHYKAARALVFLAPPAPDLLQYATDRGYRVLVFGDESTWPQQFAQHPDVFGISSAGDPA